MKRYILLLLLLLLLLCACTPEEPAPAEPTAPTAETTVPETTIPETTIPETTEPETQPLHSELYLEGVSAEDVIAYFSEVCLDAEFVNSGDPSVLQRWEEPICYCIEGEPTSEDLTVLEGFAGWLNTVEGFPGIRPWQDGDFVNLRIHFCTQEELPEIMGETYTGLDGAVTFWYDGNNAIYYGQICIRTDLSQEVRNSIILEELYNGLGPVQDTELRPDSIIYSLYSTPQALTATDELLLRLLYHPRLQCGMNGEECARIISELYY